MSFLDHVRQVLQDAAPERYPVMIGRDLFSVVAVHDDYADLHPGSVAADDSIEVSNYTRAVRLADITTIEPVPDWTITHGNVTGA